MCTSLLFFHFSNWSVPLVIATLSPFFSHQELLWGWHTNSLVLTWHLSDTGTSHETILGTCNNCLYNVCVLVKDWGWSVPLQGHISYPYLIDSPSYCCELFWHTGGFLSPKLPCDGMVNIIIFEVTVEFHLRQILRVSSEFPRCRNTFIRLVELLQVECRRTVWVSFFSGY